MALPKLPKRPADGKRAHAVLECARRTSGLLRERSAWPSALEAELETHIRQSLPITPATALNGDAKAFDETGVEIWNASSNIAHLGENSNDSRVERMFTSRKAALVRAFALLLLETSYRTRKSEDLGQRANILKISIRTARLCLREDQLDLALKALENSSQHVSKISEDAPILKISAQQHADSGYVALTRSLVDQYHLMRLLHSWKSNRLDLAEHFWQKLDCDQISVSSELFEQTADLCYEIARSLTKMHRVDDALIWYDRALLTLRRCSVEESTQEIAELSMTIGVSFVETLLSTDSVQSRKQCWAVIDQLDHTHGLNSRLALETIRLQLFLTDVPFDQDPVLQTLLRITRFPVLSEKTFKIIMQSMRKASDTASASVLFAAKDFVISRLLPVVVASGLEQETIQIWLEKATVSFIFFAAARSQDNSPPAELQVAQLLDEILNRTHTPFSAKATHAAQTIIWKASSSTGDQSLRGWIQLLRHPLFENAGHLNKGRIGRRIMASALDCNDVGAARQAFYQLPISVQNESASRYFAFKAALRSHDHELAVESLGIISQSTPSNPAYLYACALEAQQSDMRDMAIAVLQAILDKRPHGVNLPSLLRCTARLLMAEAESGRSVRSEVLPKMVDVFEAAAADIEHLRASSQDRWRVEAQWWSKNSYNLAIQFCADIHPASTLRLLTVCQRFLECYPIATGSEDLEDVIARKMMCSFLATTALIVLGRSHHEDDPAGLESYREALKHIHTFEAMHQRLTESRDFAKTQSGMPEHYAFQVLKFNLECIVRLQQWDEMGSALRACLDFPGTEKWDTLVDLLVITHEQIEAHAPDAGSLLPELFQKIINDTWRSDKDIAKLARWMRFTFSICLGEERSNFSQRLAQQAAAMAEKGQKGQHDLYPESELQWLASTCFNRAVDLLGAECVDTAMEWMDYALQIARWADDNGALHALLTSRRELAKERMRQFEQCR